PRRAVSTARDLLSRPCGLPLLDDVPDSPRLPRLGVGGACRGSHPESHPGRRRRRSPRAHRSGADAGRKAPRMNVVVVGSGIAGLTAALHASEAGHTVALVTKGTLG